MLLFTRRGRTLRISLTLNYISFRGKEFGGRAWKATLTNFNFSFNPSS